MAEISVLSEEALEEYLEIVTYLERQSAGLAERFNVVFQEAIEVLMVFADAGRDLGQFDTRRLNLRGFSYHLIYRIESQTIVIYAIPHHKRSPRYWLTRLV
jgi:toxin ParE1/3/4